MRTVKRKLPGSAAMGRRAPAGPFGAIEQRLQQAGYVPNRQLVTALRENPGQALPPALLEYLCLLLEGKVKKPRGRRKAGSVQQLLKTWAKISYPRYLKLLQWNKLRAGRILCKDLGEPNWADMPPHELAARVVARDLGQSMNVSWQHVLNMITDGK